MKTLSGYGSIKSCKTELVSFVDMTFSFEVPCQICVVGSTSSGKSTFVRHIIENRTKYFTEPIDTVFWFYGIENDAIPKGPGIFAYKGIPDMELIKAQKGKRAILVLDDLQSEMNSSAANRKILNDLFCLYAHHLGLALITMFHNVFEVSRTARINCNYFVLLRTNSDKLQVKNLMIQLFGEKSKAAVEAYDDAMKTPYSHLVVNNHVNCDPKLRLISQITNVHPIVYVPRN